MAKDKGSRYQSALAINKVAEFSGNAREARKNLSDALAAKNISTATALRDLPADETGDKEAVARLVSLARENGYLVQLGSSNGALTFNLNLPSSIRMLQAGHDNPVGIVQEGSRAVAA